MGRRGHRGGCVPDRTRHVADARRRHRCPDRRGRSGLTTAREPRNETLTYPGGLRARWRWAGSGEGAAVFALSEAGGGLHENGPTVATDYEALCRAELRLEGPRGAWS